MSNYPRVAAIVCAYNEQPRIGDVLRALLSAACINEVIVVDDGSNDGTADFVRREFPRVHVLRNEHNLGKAGSMDRGVAATTAAVIFFCDADLQNFQSIHAEQIINPVLKGECSMFIGVRNNSAQKIFIPFALNSGERTIPRKFWEELPQFYKKGFRIEAGLNAFVRRYGARGIRYEIFPYRQTLKERKYGFWEGERQRWKMNGDVLLAWARIFTLDYLIFLIKRRSPAKRVLK